MKPTKGYQFVRTPEGFMPALAQVLHNLPASAFQGMTTGDVADMINQLDSCTIYDTQEELLKLFETSSGE